MDRIALTIFLFIFATLSIVGPARAATSAWAVVDLDDDDNDGVADGRQSHGVPIHDLVSLPYSGNLRIHSLSASGVVRVIVDGTPASLPLSVSGSKAMLQALVPGRHVVATDKGQFEIRALQILALDGENRLVDLASSHASFQRTPPNRLDSLSQSTMDPDALRFVVVGHPQDLPEHMGIESRTEEGEAVDELAQAELVAIPCPRAIAQGLSCKSSWPIRVVTDTIDQSHPLVSHRSIRGQLGGGLTIRIGSVAQQIRIGGPRRTKHGPFQRFRADLTLTILRTWQGGSSSLHDDDTTARAIAGAQFRETNAMWAQCGISFGSLEERTIRIVDPPPPFLVAVGCDLGLPSSGGRIRLLVDGRSVNLDIDRGLTPEQVARKLARRIEALGMRVFRSPNALIGPGAFPVIDLEVFGPSGKPAHLSAAGNTSASSDPTMPLCIGQVDLAQGLRHFVDVDSMSGTLEERTLLKWVDDHDPTTLEAVLIPSFAQGGRIGESFIGNDRSSLRNIVFLDRIGVVTSRASNTLAHELGHVLLDMPGHPDDFGVDTPTLLMDSDASNSTAFGPRRLSVADCERVWRQSGPKASVALLRPWPWKALPKVR